MSAAAASLIGSLVSSAIKKTAKKKITKMITSKKQNKKKIAKKTSKKGSLSIGVGRDTIVEAPRIAFAMHQNSRKTSNFSVPFSTAILQIQTFTDSSVPAFTPVGTASASGVITGSLAVGLSPYTLTGGSTTLPNCFPVQINRLAASFANYRIRPGTLRLSYRTCVATTAAGTLVLGAYPADQPLNTGSTYQTISGLECATIFAPWSPLVTLNNASLKDVGLYEVNEGWRYCDFDGTVTQPEIRQSCFLNLATTGIGLTGSTVYGIIFLEGVFEFRHLQDDTSLVSIMAKEKELASTQTAQEERKQDLPEISQPQRFISPPTNMANSPYTSSSSTPVGWTSVRQ